MQVKNKKHWYLIIVILVIFVFLFINWAYYYGPIETQKKEKDRIKKIAEKNPEAAEKLRLWEEGKIELSEDEIKELVKIFSEN